MNIPRHILDYSQVTVKPFLRQTGWVQNLGHYEALCAEIIRLLREERERQKISRYAVAKTSGISQSMLSLVERGLRNPTMELVLRMADAIQADLPEVIERAKAEMANVSKKKTKDDMKASKSPGSKSRLPPSGLNL